MIRRYTMLLTPVGADKQLHAATDEVGITRVTKIFYAFVDAVAAYGHMIELYAPLPQLTGFYDMVADAAKSFKGGDVIQTIAFE